MLCSEQKKITAMTPMTLKMQKRAYFWLFSDFELKLALMCSIIFTRFLHWSEIRKPGLKIVNSHIINGLKKAKNSPFWLFLELKLIFGLICILFCTKHWFWGRIRCSGAIFLDCYIAYGLKKAKKACFRLFLYIELILELFCILFIVKFLRWGSLR